ncbi:hypothetical protein RhiirA5_358059, partial [Rhizophagus irregularis]
THPKSITECQRFWGYLRKLNFLNPMKTKTDFKNIGGEMFYKKFSSFISAYSNQQEAMVQADESNMTRIEILRKVESLLEQMSEWNRI